MSLNKRLINTSSGGEAYLIYAYAFASVGLYYYYNLIDLTDPTNITSIPVGSGVQSTSQLARSLTIDPVNKHIFGGRPDGIIKYDISTPGSLVYSAYSSGRQGYQDLQWDSNSGNIYGNWRVSSSNVGFAILNNNLGVVKSASLPTNSLPTYISTNFLTSHSYCFSSQDVYEYDWSGAGVINTVFDVPVPNSNAAYKTRTEIDQQRNILYTGDFRSINMISVVPNNTPTVLFSLYDAALGVVGGFSLDKANNVLYASCDAGLFVYNSSSSNSITKITNISTGAGRYAQIWANYEDNLLYIASMVSQETGGSNKIAVVDITNRTSPVLISTTTLSTGGFLSFDVAKAIV